MRALVLIVDASPIHLIIDGPARDGAKRTEAERAISRALIEDDFECIDARPKIGREVLDRNRNTSRLAILDDAVSAGAVLKLPRNSECQFPASPSRASTSPRSTT